MRSALDALQLTLFHHPLDPIQVQVTVCPLAGKAVLLDVPDAHCAYGAYDVSVAPYVLTAEPQAHVTTSSFVELQLTVAPSLTHAHDQFQVVLHEVTPPALHWRQRHAPGGVVEAGRVAHFPGVLSTYPKHAALSPPLIPLHTQANIAPLLFPHA